MRTDIPYEVKLALEIIESHGYEAYLVGGCVRDFIMDKLPVDYDITTSARPGEIKKVFYDYQTFDQGIKHGTVGVRINNMILEITTYRIDGEYLDARHPSEVVFTASLIEDLKRRDFTMNALALNKDNEVVDYFDGVKDINHKIIKCVGDPDKRFNEDALRILRALRFASVLGFMIDKDTGKSILSNYHLLEKVSKERIYSEFKKLLTGINAGLILKEYKEVFEFIIKHKLNDYDFITENINKVKPDLLQRLAFFLTGCKDNAESILYHLKADNRTIKSIGLLLKHIEVRLVDRVSVKKVLNAVEKNLFTDLVEIKEIIENKSYEEIKNIYSDIVKNNECYSLSQLAISGNDLNDIGIKDVKTGEVLSMLLNMVIEEKVVNNKYELLKIAKLL